jgi:hypothetical protein
MRSRNQVLSLLSFAAVAALVAPRIAAQSSSLPVVPGAAGYGMNTRAAYACGSSPTVYRVTNLNDSGTGSLRAALTASGPRVVVFETSGYIDISSDIGITSPCLTVAGQTAPSPGITVRMVPGSSEAMLLIDTHDVLLQHFRIRPGSSTCNSGIQVYGGHAYNLVYDHMSISWAQDENIVMAYPAIGVNGGMTDATFWRSITAEGLRNAPGSSGCTGGGTSNGHGIGIYGSSKHAAVIQSLIAHNMERNPWMAGAGSELLVNNLVYNWNGTEGYKVGNWVEQPGAWAQTAVGNRFVVGPNTGNMDLDPAPGGAVMFWFDSNPYNADFKAVAGNQSYRSDNTGDNAAYPGVKLHTIINQMSYDPSVSSPPSQAPVPNGLQILTSTSTESFVLANAGARPLDRDAVDARIVREVQSRTGRIPSSPSDVGGYPTLAVNRRALTLPSNPDAVTSSGYTNLEVWLHGFASALEPGGTGSTTTTAPAAPTGVRIVQN